MHSLSSRSERYHKKGDTWIADVGDFYGEPRDGIIDRNEKFCVTVGCGFIIYYFEEPFDSYSYHCEGKQWYEAGRDPQNIKWIERVWQISDDTILMVLEDGSKEKRLMNDIIKSLITKYEEPGDFTYAKATDSELELAEKELDLTLPSQYVEFLKTYGHGGICGVCTDGIGLEGSYVFVENTLEYRAEGLPENLIVIENADEWLYCIDANTGQTRPGGLFFVAYDQQLGYSDRRTCNSLKRGQEK